MLQNKKLKLYLLLLLPSVLSAVLITAATGLVILLHQFSTIQRYLQLPGNTSFLRVLLKWLDGAVNTLLGQTRTEVLVVGLFWAAVGLVVYVLLQGAAHFITELSEGLDARQYLWPRGADHNQALREAFSRGLFQLLAFAGLLVVLLGPVVRLLGSPLHAMSGGAQYAIWFVLLWLSFHVCVVLSRLIMLKPRLFG